jgi:hypothetical protein
MKLLNSAIAAGRWDLAAHTIVYALAKTINGENLHAGETGKTQKQEPASACGTPACKLAL